MLRELLLHQQCLQIYEAPFYYDKLFLVLGIADIGTMYWCTKCNWIMLYSYCFVKWQHCASYFLHLISIIILHRFPKASSKIVKQSFCSILHFSLIFNLFLLSYKFFSAPPLPLPSLSTLSHDSHVLNLIRRSYL